MKIKFHNIDAAWCRSWRKSSQVYCFQLTTYIHGRFKSEKYINFLHFSSLSADNKSNTKKQKNLWQKKKNKKTEREHEELLEAFFSIVLFLSEEKKSSKEKMSQNEDELRNLFSSQTISDGIISVFGDYFLAIDFNIVL